MKHLFVSLIILLGLLAIAEGKTLKVDTLTPSVSDGDLTLLPDGTGDIVFGTFSGVLKSSSGVLSAGTVDLTSEITGILPIANGGTGSASQNFVDLTTGQSVAGDKTLSGTINVTGKLTTTSTANGAIPCPKMTEAQRDAIGVPVAGDCVFNTDTQKLNTYDGTATAWVVAGSGAGGGLDAFLSEDFETTQTSDFSTGNNATFLTAGSSIDGALANETSSPIAGARSLKYTASTASTNDWIASNEISLDAKQRGQFVGISFYYKWSGSVDVEFVAQCTAGDTAEFTSSLDVVSTATSNTRFSTSIFISSSCTALKYGFHFVNAPTSGDILIFDDVELSTNPFVYANINEITAWEDFSSSAPSLLSAGFGTATIKRARKRRVADSLEVEVSFLAGTVAASVGYITLPDSLSIASTEVANDRFGIWTHVYSTNQIFSVAGNSGIMSYNGTNTDRMYFVLSSASSTAFDYTSAVTGYTATGDLLTLSFKVPIEGWLATSENVLTPVKSNMTDLASYTPTFTGFGTPASSSVKYARIGKYLYVVGTFVSGTQTSEEYKIGLPIINGTQLTIASDHVSDVPTGQLSFNAATGATDYAMGGSVGNSYFNLYNHPEAGAYAVINTSGPMPSSGSTYYFSVTVPIEGWTSDVVILGAIPMNQWQKNVMSTSNTPSQMDFNNLIVGKTYRLTLNVNTSAANNNVYCTATFNTSETLVSGQQLLLVNPSSDYYGVSTIFTATSSTITFAKSGSGTLTGGSGTFAILEELNYHSVETTRF